MEVIIRIINQTTGKETSMKKSAVIIIAATLCGCATLTSDAMTPVALSFSDGSSGECTLRNKRGVWSVILPTTASIRRSDDVLTYDCETSDGRKAEGSIPRTMGGKIVASAVFLDFGIVDAITDKHREYPASFVIPIAKAPIAETDAPSARVETSRKQAEGR